MAWGFIHGEIHYIAAEQKPPEAKATQTEQPRHAAHAISCRTTGERSTKQPLDSAARPPVLEQVDLDARDFSQLVVQRSKLAQHLLGHRRRRLACRGEMSSAM